MNKQKIKKITSKILKIIWIAIGVFLLLISFIFYIKMKTFTGNGLSSIGAVIGLTIFFIISLGLFLVYLLINGVILLIKFIKRRKNKK